MSRTIEVAARGPYQIIEAANKNDRFRLLSNPLMNKTDDERRVLLKRVRQAFQCLSHSIHFRFLDTGDHKFYARTQIHKAKPPHTDVCWKSTFECTESVRIDIRLQYRNFLQNDYASASKCGKLRQDFSFAVNILHELCHAVGVMRRGDLKEPHVRLDHPDKPELGYAWENFMFGGILNPFDRTSDGIKFLMHKVWSEDKEAFAAGGKEWTAMPVSYFAQWFQNETWDAIAEHGPVIVPSPPVELRLRASKIHYTVFSHDAEALEDVQRLQKQTSEHYTPLLGKAAIPSAALVVLTTKTQLTDLTSLQQSLVPIPSRISPRRNSRASTDVGSRLPPQTASISVPDKVEVSTKVVLQTVKITTRHVKKRTKRSNRCHCNGLAVVVQVIRSSPAIFPPSPLTRFRSHFQHSEA
ncbi:hypothetical protein EJ04DRAFT_515194 [Polyplosphaeria fusca]|uniref:Uncharacterized protein n=1 Tax=Polyplosphaeria fusca TaxID=682080 RepID=A0A9P4QTA2_9PLEO|nr:hypothetical protein EJ04DRAFT_515194 [Polyplosphaeria fusca]